MKYVFFGTPEFAAIILKKLIEAGMPPAVVVCNPDRPVGRKKIITPPPTKILALKHDILVLQPEILSVAKFQILNSKFDFFLVAAYAKIIPKEVLGIPRLGTIGVHPSLLPKYRGTTPIQSAILNGDKDTGTTLYLMDEKVDHGPVLAQRELNYESPKQNKFATGQVGIMNYELLIQKLADLSADLLVKTLPKFVTGEIKPQVQDETLATYTKKFASEDAFIKPEDLEAAQTGNNPEIAALIDRKIRALNPEPGTWTTKNDKRIKLLRAETSNGILKIKEFQEEGQKPKLGSML